MVSRLATEAAPTPPHVSALRNRAHSMRCRAPTTKRWRGHLEGVDVSLNHDRNESHETSDSRRDPDEYRWCIKPSDTSLCWFVSSPPQMAT
jgi:hypothetical protein